MRFFKVLAAKLRHPSIALTIVTTLLLCAFVAGDVCAILFDWHGALQYALYALSTLLLGYEIYIIVLACVKARPKVVAWAQNYRYAGRFVNDYAFRTMIFAALGGVINVAYAVFNAALGISSAINYGLVATSFWYSALAVYYIVLSFSRGSIVAQARRFDGAEISEREREKSKIKIYRDTGILLLVFTAALIAILWIITFFPDTGFRYQELFIYVAAAYTIYKVVLAVHNLIKVRGTGDFAVQAVRNLNFTAALVSVFALQVGMIAAFSEGEDISWMNALLGSVICIFAALLGVHMIIKGVRALKRAESVETSTDADGSEDTAVKQNIGADGEDVAAAKKGTEEKGNAI